MACLKCGKATTDKQMFCEECLAVMQKYPVKPDTAIHLPHRDVTHQEKKPQVRHRESTLAEQAEGLRKLIRLLLAILGVMSILLLVTAGMLLHEMQKEAPAPAIGRNYTTTVTSTQP